MHTLEQLQQYLSYNPDTGVFTWKRSTRGRRAGDIAGTNHNGYLVIYLEGKRYALHRVAWLFITGAWPQQEIDHINGIRNDNRASNLRDVSHAENLQGARTLSPRNKTGHTGVSWSKQKNCYTATIMRNGKAKFLGCFDKLEDAVAARANHEGIAEPSKTYRQRRKSVAPMYFRC